MFLYSFTGAILNEQNNCIVNGDMENTISETCSYNGICLCTGYCQCKKKYATYPFDSNKQCNYKRKSRIDALIHHFFIGLLLGGGEMYLGNEQLGMLQFWLFIPLIVIVFFVSIAVPKTCNYSYGLTSFIAIMMILFWIIDFVKIEDGSRKDGNGIETYY